MKVGKEEIMGMLAAIEGWNLRPAAGAAFRTSLPYEGTRPVYEFTGAIANEAMGGEVGLGEYGKARWSARRV